MAVCRVYHDGVGAGLYQRLHALKRVVRHAHAGSHAQAAFCVLAGHRFVFGLGYVFVGDEPHELAVFVYDGQLFNFVFLQYLSGGGQVRLLGGRHQVLFRHDMVDRFAKVFLETQVAVRHDAHQVHVVVHNGDATDVIFLHQAQRIAHGRTALDGHGVVNHAVLGPLHDGHLACLLLDGHILMNDADTALTRDSNGHRRLGHRIHCRRNERNLKLNVAGKLGIQRHRAGQHVRISRYEKYVVKGQSVLDNSVSNK